MKNVSFTEWYYNKREHLLQLIKMKNVSFTEWYYKREHLSQLIINLVISIFVSFLIFLIYGVINWGLNIGGGFLNDNLGENSFLKSPINRLGNFFRQEGVKQVISIIPIIMILFYRHMKFAKEYCLKYRRDKTFLDDMKKIESNINNDHIYGIFKNYISRHASTISNNQLQNLDQLNRDYVNLASAVDLTSFDNRNLSNDESGNITIKEGALSRLRRERVLQVCESLLHGKVTLFYATEFHLKEIMSDPAKWNDDKAYRKALQNDDNIKKYTTTKRRIIGIKDNDYKNIKELQKECLISYLQWHIDNGWDACLYVISDDCFPLEVKNLGENIEYCNDLTDFLYVEYDTKDEDCVVFAQNEAGLCKYFKHPSNQCHNPVSKYKSLFEFLWNNQNKDGIIQKQSQYYKVDKQLISNLSN